MRGGLNLVTKGRGAEEIVARYYEKHGYEG